MVPKVKNLDRISRFDKISRCGSRIGCHTWNYFYLEAAYLEKSVKILLGGIHDPSSFGYLPIMRIFAIQQKQNGFQVSLVKILLL